MSFADSVQDVYKDEWRCLFILGEGGVNTKDRDYSIELDGEEKMLLNRILNTISILAAVR